MHTPTAMYVNRCSLGQTYNLLISRNEQNVLFIYVSLSINKLTNAILQGSFSFAIFHFVAKWPIFIGAVTVNLNHFKNYSPSGSAFQSLNSTKQGT